MSRVSSAVCPCIAALLIAVTLAGCGGSGGSGGGGGGGSVSSVPPFDLASSIAIADLKNDGTLDLAVAGAHIAGPPPHPGFCSVILQNPSSPGTFAHGVHYATGTDSGALAVGDLNEDGHLDLAVGNGTSHDVSVLFQDPGNAGAFLSAMNLSAGSYVNGVAIGDLNGDGRLDIAVAATKLLVFFQNSSGPPGHFLSPSTLSLGTQPANVAIGDVDGDGKLDLVVALVDSNQVAVLLQDPLNAGTFLPAISFAVGQQPIAVKIADLKGDGLADLALANLGSPSDLTTASVSVLLQDFAHPGQFLPATNYHTGTASEDVAIGDLNGDDKPDLVVANSGGSVSVLLQDPATPGGFLPAVNYPGKGPSSVGIGDLNGDGLPDIAVADSTSATVMFQNPGAPGTFFAPVGLGL